MKVDVLKYPIDLVKWPTSRALELGALIVRMGKREHIAERLRVEEPRSRARIAMKSAENALHREDPDVDLGMVEIFRASGAIDKIAKNDSVMAKEIAPEIVYLAIELPDRKKEIEVAERITEVSFRQIVDSINDKGM